MNSILQWSHKKYVKEQLEYEGFSSVFIDYLGYFDSLSILKEISEIAPKLKEENGLALTFVASLPLSKNPNFETWLEMDTNKNPPKIYLEELELEKSYYKNAQKYYDSMRNPYDELIIDLQDLSFFYTSDWDNEEKGFHRFVYALIADEYGI
jgi:hypothetical protein